jgi:pimeloyl-ACP methyl ester carboxylesterase
VQFKTVNINGLDIFYRRAGNRGNPTILLLHGFPSSSHMYQNLINELTDDYRTIAPDYPGIGNSDQPPMNDTSLNEHHMKAARIVKVNELLQVQELQTSKAESGIGFLHIVHRQ